MDVSWQHLIILLHGVANVDTTCEAISDVIACNPEELPNIFHEIVVNLVISDAMTLRLNGSFLLGKLIKRFSSILRPLLSESKSDGELFNFHLLQVQSIIADDESFLISTCSSDAVNLDLYQKGWLLQQQKALRKRLKLESHSSDVDSAELFDESIESYISGNDVCTQRYVDECALKPKSLNLRTNNRNSMTDETWLARLTRYMVVGLLSSRWETRHGYALGLTRVVTELFPFNEGSSAALIQREERLPAFLVDDILCCGMCLLVVDRLMDFGTHEEGAALSQISPVKEAVGSLLAHALQSTSCQSKIAKMWSMIMDMIRSDTSEQDKRNNQTSQVSGNGHEFRRGRWTVVLGGFVAVKHFIAWHPRYVWNNFSFLQFISSIANCGATSLNIASREEIVLAMCGAVLEFCSQYSTDIHYLVDPLIARCDIISVVDVLNGLNLVASSLTATLSMNVTFTTCNSVESPVTSVLHVGDGYVSSEVLKHLCSILVHMQSLVVTILQCGCMSDDIAALVVQVTYNFMQCMVLLVGALPLYCIDTTLKCVQMCGSYIEYAIATINRPGLNFKQNRVGRAEEEDKEEEDRAGVFDCFSQSHQLLARLVAASLLHSDRPVADLSLLDASSAGPVGPASHRKGPSEAGVSESILTSKVNVTSATTVPLATKKKMHLLVDDDTARWWEVRRVWVYAAQQCIVLVNGVFRSIDRQEFIPLLYCELLNLVSRTVAMTASGEIKLPLKQSSDTLSSAGTPNVSVGSRSLDSWMHQVWEDLLIMAHSHALREEKERELHARYSGAHLIQSVRHLHSRKRCLWNFDGEGKHMQFSLFVTHLLLATRDAMDHPEIGRDDAISSLVQAVKDAVCVAKSDVETSFQQQAMTKKSRFSFSIVPDNNSTNVDALTQNRHSVAAASTSGYDERNSALSVVIEAIVSIAISIVNTGPAATKDLGRLSGFLSQALFEDSILNRKRQVLRCSSAEILIEWLDLWAFLPTSVNEGEDAHHASCPGKVFELLGKAADKVDAMISLQGLGGKTAGEVLRCQIVPRIAHSVIRYHRQHLIPSGGAPGFLDCLLFDLLEFVRVSCAGNRIHTQRLNTARQVMFLVCQELREELFSQHHRFLSQIIKEPVFLPLLVTLILALASSSHLDEIKALIYDYQVVDAILDGYVAMKILIGVDKERDDEAAKLSHLAVAGLTAMLHICASHSPPTEGFPDAYEHLANTIATALHSRISLSGASNNQPVDAPAHIASLSVLLMQEQDAQGAVLACFETWFAAALHGLGDSNTAVRHSCTSIFRFLVPLAPLAQQTVTARATSSRGLDPINGDIVGSGSLRQDALELLEHIFMKKSAPCLTSSPSERDRRIVAMIRQSTNLIKHPSRETKVEGPSDSPLRNYQWIGISWLTQLRRFGLNGILADEMGLGKTLQALTTIAVLRLERNFDTKPSLIVCPASLVLHWQSEIAQYFPAHMLQPVPFSLSATTGRVAGGIRFNDTDAAATAWFQALWQRHHDFDTIGVEGANARGAQVVIMSYNAVRKYAKAVKQGFPCWEYIVLDEAHLIKSPATSTAKAIFALTSNHRVALTGTPIQNQVHEVWSLMHYVLPDYLGDYATFRRDYVHPIQKSFNAQRDLCLGKIALPREQLAVAEEVEANSKIPVNATSGTTNAAPALETVPVAKADPTAEVEQVGSMLELVNDQPLGSVSSTAKTLDSSNAVTNTGTVTGTVSFTATAPAASGLLAKFYRTVDVSSTGLGLLRKLHKQILPFILRRTKTNVASDLPAKTVIDVLCPLSQAQSQLYASYLQTRHTSDDLLLTHTMVWSRAQQEQQRRTSSESPPPPPPPLCVDSSTAHGLAHEGNHSSAAMTVSSSSSRSSLLAGDRDANGDSGFVSSGWQSIQMGGMSAGGDAGTGTGAGVLPDLIEEGEEEEEAHESDRSKADRFGMIAREKAALKQPHSSAQHSFQIIQYLRLLCVHPALVVNKDEHRQYHSHLLQSMQSSGKLLKLSQLLVTSGVVRKEEYAANNILSFDRFMLMMSGDEEQDTRVFANVANEEEEDITGAEEGQEEQEEQEETLIISTKREDDTAAAGRKRKIGEALPQEQQRRHRHHDHAATAESAAVTHAMQSLAATIHTEPQHRCLIFAQHKSVLDLVEELVLKMYFPTVRYERLDGDVAPHKRAVISQQFQAISATHSHSHFAAELGSSQSMKNNSVVAFPDRDATVTGGTGIGDEDEAQKELVKQLKTALPSVKAAAAAARPASSSSSSTTTTTRTTTSTTTATATAAVAANGKEDEIRLLLMTTKACGLGLNLTAADTVFFIEHDWNPFVDLQAMDRVHRLGQTQPVTVYRLLAESTIEARIMNLQGMKGIVANEIINEENAGDGVGSNTSASGSALMESLLSVHSKA